MRTLILIKYDFKALYEKGLKVRFTERVKPQIKYDYFIYMYRSDDQTENSDGQDREGSK